MNTKGTRGIKASTRKWLSTVMKGAKKQGVKVTVLRHTRCAFCGKRATKYSTGLVACKHCRTDYTGGKR